MNLIMRVWFPIMFIILVAYFYVALVLVPDEVEVIEREVKTTRYEIVLECERISSQSTNEDWSYAKCLENLEKAREAEGILTI